MKFVRRWSQWLKERTKDSADSEWEQIVLRLVLGLGVTIYFAFPWREGQVLSDTFYSAPSLLMMGAYFAAVILAAARLANPKKSRIRRVVGNLIDVVTLSILMTIGGGESIYIFGIYLWVTLGNGFRYGAKYLYFSLIISVIGFVVAISYGEYWQGEKTKELGTSLLFLLIIIPMYTSFLIKKLHTAVAEAKQANEAKSRFLANMSHELRTPLNGVIGLGELLRETELNKKQYELASTMHNSAHTLLTLIEKVLDISKIEAGKIEITKGQMDLHALVNSVLSMQVPIGMAKDLSVSCSIDSDVPFLLEGDVQHLRQVLINLMGNAIKFTQQGSVNLHVSCVSNNSNEEVRIRFEIKDTGIGISSDLIEQVFDDFTQVGSKVEGGTGLGTTISKELVELMDGKIGVESKLYVGSKFWFELPFKTIPYRSLDISENHLLVMMAESTISQLRTTLGGWNIGYDEVSSPAHALKLLNGAMNQGAGYKVVLIDTECLSDLSPKQFSDILKAERLLEGTSWILLNDLESLTASDIGDHYLSVIHDLRDKRLLFNAIHAAQSIHSNGENVVSLSDHYAKQSGANSLTILVAEDNLVNQRVIEGILKRSGHKVILAGDGEKALDLLLEKIEQIDLVIVDKNMPKRSGNEVVLALKYMEGAKHIPTVMLTADATPEARQASIDAGVNEFITKPFDSKELLEIIAKLGRQHKKLVMDKSIVLNGNTEVLADRRSGKQEEKWFDENVFQSLLMLDTDPAFIAKLVQSFILDGEKHIARINSAVDDDYLQLRESLHALKGSAAELGANELVEICKVGEAYKPYDIGTEKILQLNKDIKFKYSNTVAALNDAVSKAAV